MRVLRLVVFAFVGFVAACSSRVEYPNANITAPTTAININTASVDDLEKLPGIGRKTADTIIAFRSENGPFRRVEHLMLIRGISEDRFIELRSYIRVE